MAPQRERELATERDHREQHVRELQQEHAVSRV